MPVSLWLLAVSVVIPPIVRRSMERLTGETLHAVLASNASALELWLGAVADHAAAQLSQPAIAAAATAVLQQHAAATTWNLETLSADSNFQALQAIDFQPHVGWAVLNVGGVVVASNQLELVNQPLPIPPLAMEQVINRQATVCVPFPLPVALSNDEPHYAIAGGAMMCGLAPVADDARTIGSLALLINPLDRFSEILSLGRPGATGETYAVDRQGVLVSPSRFEDQLRDAGLLDRDRRVRSPLNVVIRNPGVDLTRGGQPALPRSEQPLTTMANQTTRGATGTNVRGYRDYRGVWVVGAWRWLPEYGLGITTEMSYAEAYRPVGLLRRAWFGLLLSVAGVALLSILITGFRARRSPDPSASGAHRLGNYELVDLIGRGGMGNVYRGHHQALRRDVAIKVLRNDSDVLEQTIARFEREVQLTAQLRHPNTIDIYDFGRTTDGTFFYVMELVDGITLQQLVDQYGRQPPERVIHLLLQVCGSLSEAHQLGMVHRDIKPSNILLTAQSGLYDLIKVLDFGLVKRIDEDLESSVADAELTSSDGITGTPMYMSPEAVRDAAAADAKSDLYSVGAVGYILLTGQPVFAGDSSVDVCLQQLNDDPLRPAERVGLPLPEDLQNVLMSCLRKSPDERPMSADDLADSLRYCHDAGKWSAAQAMHWWEVETV